MSAANVRFYFSFRSPFAAVAFHRLRRAVQFREVEIELVPVWPEIIFGGHMDNPSDNVFKMAYIFNDAARQAELAGMNPDPFRMLARQFALPEEFDYTREKVGVPLPPEHWEVPHAAFLFAQRYGRAWTFGEAVFTRRFNLDGAGFFDVMDPSVVALIADAAGLDGTEAAAAHARGEFVARRQQIMRAGERDGVFGVPFFVLANDSVRETFWGNDRLEYLLKSLLGSEQLPTISKADLKQVQPNRN
jgi:2-hydroxychromene-2-carboxylate isomerase